MMRFKCLLSTLTMGTDHFHLLQTFFQLGNIEFFSARKGTLSWAWTLSWTWWSSQEKPPNLKSWDVAQNSIKIPLTCKVKKCHSKQSRMRYAISIFIWYMSRVVLFLYGSSLFVRELRWKWWLFFCQWKLLCACIRLKDVVACVACGHSHDPRNDPSHLTCHYLPSNSFSFHKLDPKTTLQWNARILADAYPTLLQRQRQQTEAKVLTPIVLLKT